MDPIGSLLAIKAPGDRHDFSLASIDHGRRRRVGDPFTWDERRVIQRRSPFVIDPSP
jgi:hypothetical protein